MINNDDDDNKIDDGDGSGGGDDDDDEWWWMMVMKNDDNDEWWWQWAPSVTAMHTMYKSITDILNVTYVWEIPLEGQQPTGFFVIGGFVFSQQWCFITPGPCPTNGISIKYKIQ